MAAVTERWTSFLDDQFQVFVTWDDVSGNLASVRIVNTSVDRVGTFNAQRGTRPVQSFTSQPGTDQTFSLPTGQQTRYTLTQNPDGSWQASAFVAWATF